MHEAPIAPDDPTLPGKPRSSAVYELAAKAALAWFAAKDRLLPKRHALPTAK